MDEKKTLQRCTEALSCVKAHSLPEEHKDKMRKRRRKKEECEGYEAGLASYSSAVYVLEICIKKQQLVGRLPGSSVQHLRYGR